MNGLPGSPNDSEDFPAFIAFVLACVLLAIIVANAWPVCAWCGVAAATYAVCRRRENAWAKAATSIAGPSAIGFSILTACLVVFNLFLTGSDLPRLVSRTELVLLHLSRALPAWTKLALWQLVLILCGLVLVNRFVPSISLVPKFLRATKLLARCTATLAAASSFSFFTNDAVLGAAVAGPQARLTARYLQSQQRERDHLERYLLVRTRAEVLHALPPQQQAVLVDVHHTLSLVEHRSPSAASEIVKTIARDHFRQAPSSSTESVAQRAPSDKSATVGPLHVLDMSPPPEELTEDPDTVLASQEEREAAARQLADNAQKALEEAMKALVGIGTKSSVTLVHALLDPLLEAVSLPAAPELASFVDKVSDEYVKQVVDPFVKKWSTSLAKTLPQPTSTLTSKSSRIMLVRAIVLERLQAARFLAERAVLRLPAQATFTSGQVDARARLTLPDFTPAVPYPDMRSWIEEWNKQHPDSPLPMSPVKTDSLWRQIMNERNLARQSAATPASIPLPDGVTEKDYDAARRDAADALRLLDTFSPLAPDVGLRPDVTDAISKALAADRKVLAQYEPTFTAIAKQREVAERARREAEVRRQEEIRAREIAREAARRAEARRIP
jgi:hypothetical protein